MQKTKFYTDEQKEISSFVKIIIGMVLILFVMYFVTNKIASNNVDYSKTYTDGSVGYSSIIIGSLLNRADEEYYVLIFDSENVDNTYVINKASEYASDEKSLPLYTADLSHELNKKFLSDKSSYKKDSLDNFKVSGTTLVKVKGSSIVKFIEGIDNIKKELN